MEKKTTLTSFFYGVTKLKVRVITFDTKENTIEDKTFQEFHSDDFDIYITECYEELENGEIYGLKIIRSDGIRKIPTIFRRIPELETACVPA